MTEMVERVARILCKQELVGRSETWEDFHESFHERWKDNAHTIIEVMREPTRKQVLAGKDAVRGFDKRQAWMTLLPGAWRAMIDAALADKKEKAAEMNLR